MAAHRVLRFRFLGAQFFCLFWSCAALNAQQTAAQQIQLPVTNGLIRWWPNLFDVHDEVTGQEGVVMGVLPPVETGKDDETEFGAHTGWVQLRPAITNQTFTLAFWMRSQPRQWSGRPVVFGQESAKSRWVLRLFENAMDRYAVVTGDLNPEEREEYFIVPKESWHHVAVACRDDATAIVWLDGVRKVNSHVRHSLPALSQWLTVGNSVKGDDQWEGGLRDLCAFDRVLDDEEVRTLIGAGLPKCPARNSPARLAAVVTTNVPTWSTNVVPTPVQELIHRRYTTEDGLAGNIVQAVLQATNGYLWVGVEGGLSRFDGRKFEVFNWENTPALKIIGSDIMSLTEAADGTIWAGSYGGLLRFRNGEFTAFTNGLPERFVLQAEPADGDSLWVAGYRIETPDRGPGRLRRFRPESGTSDGEVIVPGQVRRLVPVTNGVWLATENPEALLFWDGKTATPVVAAMVASAPAALNAGSVVLPPGTQCRGWMNPLNDLERWAEIKLGPAGPVFHWLWPGAPQRPNVGRWSGLAGAETWLGSRPGLALLRHERVLPVVFANRTSPPDVVCASANREGGLWFGTEEDGLHFVQERLVRVFTARDGLGVDDIRSVCVGGKGRLWAGASRRLDENWETFVPGVVSSVAESPIGEVWMGTKQTGLHSLLRMKDPERTSPVAFDLPGLDFAEPNSLRFTSDGTLWVACNRGLTWVTPECQRGRGVEGTSGLSAGGFGRFTTGRELPNVTPVGIIEDRDGSVWAGTMGGGLIHVVGSRVEILTKRDGLAGEYCTPLQEDVSGALWIASDGGLMRRKGGQFQTLRPADGLPNDLFSALVQDDLGHFWLPGKRGIHRLERSEVEAFFDGRLSRVRSVTLGVRDGLLTPECYSLNQPCAAKTPDGRIWVATRNGVAMFDPSQVRLNVQPPPTLIERLLVNRKEMAVPAGARNGRTSQSANDRVVRLPAGSGRRLEFYYTSVNLTTADRVRFRYRLHGYDADWEPETDLRLAFYTNLRPGEYRFHVKAANDHGIWNEEPTRLSFVIAPYLWETKSFYLGVALVITGVALALHWRRVRVLRRLQELSHQQSLAAEKTRIAADMHDELGATLTQIVILGETAKSQVANGSQTRATLDRISQAARDVTSRMSDLIWIINPRHDTLENLTVYLREYAAKQFEGSAIRPRLDIGPAPADWVVSATFRRNVLLVVTEALHNMVKHSGASEMCLRLAVESSELVIQIEDNGRGFDVKSRSSTGNGLGNMQRRMADLGGSFHVQSSSGEGTRIQLRVPLPVTTAKL